MTYPQPTVKVVSDGPRGFSIINKSDFDEEVHEIFEEPESADTMEGGDGENQTTEADGDGAGADTVEVSGSGEPDGNDDDAEDGSDDGASEDGNYTVDGAGEDNDEKPSRSEIGKMTKPQLREALTAVEVPWGDDDDVKDLAAKLRGFWYPEDD